MLKSLANILSVSVIIMLGYRVRVREQFKEGIGEV